MPSQVTWESQVRQMLDTVNHRTVWLCEKWSEDAVNFARKRLDKLGVSHVPAEVRPVQVFKTDAMRCQDRQQPTRQIYVPRLMPISEGISSMALREFVGQPEEIMEVVGNMLLNEGIQRLQDMTMIATVLTNQTAGNPWSNANAFLGVGASVTAEAATQTDLQTTPFYKAMNATYPSRSGQTVSFQSDFTTTEANIVWNEWSVSAGATSASGAGFTVGTTNLNRKVASLGTKASGTWTLTSQITFS